MMDENIFHKAVHAIDAGDIELLQQLLNDYPNLVSTRLTQPDENYFKFPYLLWHIANNPVRQEKMPPNIVAITQLISDYARKNAAETFQHQLDYTLGLVVTGRVPRQSGVQIELIDLLPEEGAIARKVEGALAHGNIEAAKHLISKGGTLTLTAAICLDLNDEVQKVSLF